MSDQSKSDAAPNASLPPHDKAAPEEAAPAASSNGAGAKPADRAAATTKLSGSISGDPRPSADADSKPSDKSDNPGAPADDRQAAIPTAAEKAAPRAADTAAVPRAADTAAIPAEATVPAAAASAAVPAPAAAAAVVPVAAPAPRWWMFWRRKRVRPVIEWRSFSGWYILAWLLDLAFLAHLLSKGAPTPAAGEKLPWTWLAQVGGACGLAFLLSFIVPITLLDDSSHYRRAWWVAWLWPVVMALMLATDAVALANVALKVAPLIEALKHKSSLP